MDFFGSMPAASQSLTISIVSCRMSAGLSNRVVNAMHVGRKSSRTCPAGRRGVRRCPPAAQRCRRPVGVASEDAWVG